jgi:hypothetical protein
MNNWTVEDLELIDATDEICVAPLRADGRRPFTAIWVVRVGDHVYIRSYRGRGGRWFRDALQSKAGRIRAGGEERDVAFVEGDDGETAALDDAYRTKYRRHGRTYVDAMVGADAAAATLRLVRAGPTAKAG